MDITVYTYHILIYDIYIYALFDLSSTRNKLRCKRNDNFLWATLFYTLRTINSEGAKTSAGFFGRKQFNMPSRYEQRKNPGLLSIVLVG